MLPPSNPAAFGLYLTDPEYTGVSAFVRSCPFVGAAWIYGSRHSGSRRTKDKPTPPDIDLAIELRNVPAGEETYAMFEVRHSAAVFFEDQPQFGLTVKEGAPGCVQIEFPGKEGSALASYIEADGATLIYSRGR